VGGQKGLQMDFDAKGPGGNEPGDMRMQCNLMEGFMSGRPKRPSNGL